MDCKEHLFNYYPISKRYRCIKCQLVTRTIGERDKLLKKKMGN